MKKTWRDLTLSVQEEFRFFASRKIDKMTALIVVIFVLSILDAIFTLTWIKSGLAVEVNPFLVNLLEKGDFAFLGTKILLTGLGCVFLEKSRKKSKLARIGIVAIFAVYCLLTFYHCVGALQSVHHDLLPDFVDDALLWLS